MKEFNLHNKNIKSGFKAPSNYFENLEDKIMTKIEVNQNKPTIKLWQKSTFWFSNIAACIVLFVAGIYYYNYNIYQKLDENSIENYIISNTTSEEIYKNFNEKDFEELSEKILNAEDLQEYVTIDYHYYSNYEK